MDDEEIAEALEKCKGNISQVAKKFKVARQSIYDRIQKSPLLKSVQHDAREASLDNAESVLDVAVNEGEGWAVCFKLKTLGKARGYVERQEVTGADGAPVSAVTEIVVRTRQEASEMLKLTENAGPNDGAHVEE